ncbi:MAG: hypothetical protein ACRYG8_02195 [Janthinobacterium lividum]
MRTIIGSDGPARAGDERPGDADRVRTRPRGGLLWRCLVALGQSVLDGLSEFGRCHHGGHSDQRRPPNDGRRAPSVVRRG